MPILRMMGCVIHNLVHEFYLEMGKQDPNAYHQIVMVHGLTVIVSADAIVKFLHMPGLQLYQKAIPLLLYQRALRWVEHTCEKCKSCWPPCTTRGHRMSLRHIWRQRSQRQGNKHMLPTRRAHSGSIGSQPRTIRRKLVSVRLSGEDYSYYE